MKVLLLENIHRTAVEALVDRGYEVEVRSGSLGEGELVEALAGVALLGIRSNTRVSAAVLEQAPDLLAIGCFCIGTNQVDLDAASARGVAVFNAPYSNTRSVVELVVGEIVALSRRLSEKSALLHGGVWDKSAAGSNEVRGRTLGIVGYGNIGTQLGTVAEALGMRVLFFDVADRPAHGNARRTGSLVELLGEADVVSVHVDGRPGNGGLFGAEQFAAMRAGALFVNASRGMVVDEVALRDRLLSGALAGAAIDVFPVEPKAQGDPFVSVLQGLPNVILTPHIGGSTAQAQAEIGSFVAGKLAGFVADASTAMSVNLPPVAAAPAPTSGGRVALLHRNVPGVLAEVNTVLAEHGENIVGQQLSTRGEYGYVVIDVATPISAATLAAVGTSGHTVWVRTWSTP